MSNILKHTRLSLLVLGVSVFMLGAALILAIGNVSANHTSGNPMTFGYVSDGVQPIEGAQIQNCWDDSTQPDPFACSPSGANASTDSDGHWYNQGVAEGFWTVWAEKDGNHSQYAMFYFDGVSTYQVEELFLSDSGSGGSFIPAAPSPPIPSPPPSSTTIFLMWDDYADNEDSYYVERSPAGAESWTVIVALGANTTSYADTAVTPGVSYDYRVQACLSAVGCSGYGQLWGISTDPGTYPPGEPPVPPMNGTLSGFVYQDGNGVPNVFIEIFQEGAGGYWSMSTDGSGLYWITGLPLGWTYRIQASPNFGSNVADEYRTLNSASPENSADFYLDDSNQQTTNFTISGNVQFVSGSPVTDAFVEAYNPANGDFFGDNTDSSGRYDISVPCGTWDMWVKPSDFNNTDWFFSGYTQSVTFDCGAASDSEVRDFQVNQTDTTVTGRILYPGGVVPPEYDTYVTFWNSTGEFGGSPDANGYFSISGQAGSYEMDVWSNNEDYTAPATFGTITLLSGQTLDLGTVTLVTKDAAIEGFVRGGGGEGLAGVQVNAHVPGGNGWAETFTLSDGSYRLQVVAGTWEVYVEPDASLEIVIIDPYRSVSVASNQTVSGVDFSAIATDAIISGRILDQNGTMLTSIDAQVYVEGEDYGVNAFGGAFTMPVQAGTYDLNVWVAPESGFFSAGSVSVTVADGDVAVIDLVVISAEGGGTIRGGLVDQNGALVRNIEFEVFAGAGSTWIPGIVDVENGTYVLNVPPGNWWVGIELFDDSYAVRDGHEIGVAAGDNILFNFDLLEATSVIEVVVQAPDGSALPWVGIEASLFSILTIVDNLAELEDEFDNAFYGNSDSDGIATIPVPAGTYYLHAFVDRGDDLISPPEVAVTVVEGQTVRVTIVFRVANATISGQVLVQDTGAPAIDVFVYAWSQSGGLTDAEVDAAGNYVLRVTSGDVWYVKAGADVNGEFYKAEPIAIAALPPGGSVVQNIVLKPTGFIIPETFATVHDVNEPFASTLDDGTSISGAANAFGTTGEVTITIKPNLDAPEYAGTLIIGIPYDVEVRTSDGTIVKELNGSILISIPYSQDAITAVGILEKDLQIGFLDPTTGVWVRLDSTIVDTTNNIATATATHLTRFALLTPSYASIVGPTIKEGDLIRGPDGVKVWIVNADGFKRHIFNPAVFGMYGHFVWENIHEVSQSTLDSYVTSDLYRADGDQKVFFLEEVDEANGIANKRWLNFSAAEFLVRGYDWLQVFVINSVERDFYQEGTPIT